MLILEENVCNDNEIEERKEFDSMLRDYKFWQKCRFLDPQEFRLLFYLASFYPAFPSIDKIIDGTGMSDRDIKRVIKRLEAKLILKVNRGWKLINSRKVRVNVYLIDRIKVKEMFNETHKKDVEIVEEIDEVQQVTGQIGLKQCNKLQARLASSYRPDWPTILKKRNLKIKTTTDKQKKESSRRDFFEIPENLKRIGLTNEHITHKDIKSRHSVDQINLFLQYIDFDIQHNKKLESIKENPIAYFLSILKNGPYDRPKNYITFDDLFKKFIDEMPEEEKQKYDLQEGSDDLKEWRKDYEYKKELYEEDLKNYLITTKGNLR